MEGEKEKEIGEIVCVCVCVCVCQREMIMMLEVKETVQGGRRGEVMGWDDC